MAKEVFSEKYSAVTMREWRSRNPEKAAEWRQQMKNWRRENPASRLLSSARFRAKKKGIEFSLSKSDIYPLPTICPVLGIPLKLEGGSSRKDPCSPSLDRIDNSKGYVPGNVIVVSWRANNLKRDASMDELQMIVDFYRKWRAAA